MAKAKKTQKTTAKSVAKKAPAKAAQKAKKNAKPAAKAQAAKKTKATSAKKSSAKPAVKTAAKSAPNVIPLRRSQREWSKMISPLDDRVLVELESTERVTPGGLFIPDTAEITGNFHGKVVAVGRGHRDKKGRLRPLELKVGDRILLQQWSGNEIEIDGEKLRLIRESEVLGTLE